MAGSAVGAEGFAELVEGGVDVFVAVFCAKLFGEFDGFVDGDGRVDVEALNQFVHANPEDATLYRVQGAGAAVGVFGDAGVVEVAFFADGVEGGIEVVVVNVADFGVNEAVAAHAPRVVAAHLPLVEGLQELAAGAAALFDCLAFEVFHIVIGVGLSCPPASGAGFYAGLSVR